MNDQHIPDASSEPGISITRVFAAPRERIWAEWTTPEAFADWYGGEVEIPLDTVEMDVREGGYWKATMLPRWTAGDQLDRGVPRGEGA